MKTDPEDEFMKKENKILDQAESVNANISMHIHVFWIQCANLSGSVQLDQSNVLFTNLLFKEEKAVFVVGGSYL